MSINDTSDGGVAAAMAMAHEFAMLKASAKVWKMKEARFTGEIAALSRQNEELQEKNKTLEISNSTVQAEVHRVMVVCIAAEARLNRTIAAVSKIFVEDKEAKGDNECGINETERVVIDHCLRKLSDEERGKFLCECGSLDGGFVFRNQIRREMDAIGRDPERQAELMADESRAAGLHGEAEGSSQESVKKKKKSKGKKKSKH